MTSSPKCVYCGTTQGLRIYCDERPIGRGIECICAECFTGTDTGPCFDDLAEAPKIDWAAWARDRVEYEDPYGYRRGERF